MMELFAISTTW